MKSKRKGSFLLNLSSRVPKGFTLVELAMVLVVIGVLLTLGVGLMGPLIKQQKLAKSRKILEEIKEAVIGYVLTHRTLPPNLSVLGVRTKDAFGKEILYLPASLSDVCQETSTSLSLLEECEDTSCSTYQARRDNLAFVLASGSENQNIQTNEISGLVKTYQPQVKVDDYSSDFLRLENYDDLVTYVSLYQLKGAISCPASASSCSRYQVAIFNYTSPNTDLSYQLNSSCNLLGRRTILSDLSPDEILQIFLNDTTCSSSNRIIWEARLQDADLNGDCEVDLKCYSSGGSVICVNQ